MKSTQAVGFCLSAWSTGAALRAVDGVLLEDLVDLFFFVVRAFDDLALFALAFGDVVFGIAAGRKITTEPHRDRTCSDLGKARKNNDAGRGYSSRETGCKSKGNSKSVREPDDDIAHGLGGLEVSFSVGSRGCVAQ